MSFNEHCKILSAMLKVMKKKTSKLKKKHITSIRNDTNNYLL